MFETIPMTPQGSLKKLAMAIMLGAGLLASGCAVGPDFASPLPQAPAQAAFSNSGSASFSTAEPTAVWWKLYEDPALNAAIEEALSVNTDLRIASANLMRAEAVLSEASRARLPSTSVDAAVTKSRSNFFLAEPLAVENTVYRVDLGASYQVDLFGRVRRTIEASAANADAVRALFHTTRITVAAATAGAYAQACALGSQVDVAQNNTALHERSYQLTQQLRDAGRGTALDVASAAAAHAQSQAMLADLRAQRNSALYGLAVLMGRPPAAFPQAAADCRTPPTLTQAIPVGDGASLLLRRPDVREAEQALAAATARAGIVAAEFYPSVSFGGSIGSAALSGSELGQGSTQVWNLGPLLSWTFPNISSTLARKAQADAEIDVALAHFDGTWLEALRETESALSSYANELERTAALRTARQHYADAARLAHARFTAGQLSFLDVLQSELSLASADLTLAQAQARLSTLQISLFLALGGGWDAPESL